MQHRASICLMLALCVFLSVGCKRNSRSDVWSDYDYLSPVPHDAGIAVDPAYRGLPRGPQVYDNDDSYVIPYGSGLCASDGNYQECE